MSENPLLSALRKSSSWSELAARLGKTEESARAEVAALLQSRVPATSGTVLVPDVSASIARDAFGVPHITAPTEAEAYYALGFAWGQDRLWQLDYFRRVGSGRLSEVLGPAWIESDKLHRTLDLRRVAMANRDQMAAAELEVLEAFCGGVNVARSLALRDGLPFEFELLEYEPETWTPVCSLVAMRAFWWQLTGRFPILCVPEFARRHLGDGPLFEALLQVEGGGPNGEATIWPRGQAYPHLPRWAGNSDSPRFADAGAPGSNNWVIGPRRSTTGAPILASDPHVPFSMPNVWYEAHLSAGDFELCGAFGPGYPGCFYGRNRDVAWGLTNNISLLRDLYLEVTAEFDELRYRRGDHWKGMTTRHETIAVRGGAPVELEVREVDHGPIVSDVLPHFAQNGEDISVRWIGHDATREMETMFRYARAATTADFHECLRDWHCPTFNFMIADRHGSIGYQLTGKIPLRKSPARGYRPGDDPEHAWQGYVPYECMPACSEPAEGWLGSANNRAVNDDWPYPLSGTWPSDYRMQRIVQLLNAPGSFTTEAMRDGQMDEYCPRAAEWSGPAVRALREIGVDHPLLAEIESWDHVYGVDSRPAAVFEAFFVQWGRLTILRRFSKDMLPFLFPNAAGMYERLLEEDAVGWFSSPKERVETLRAAWNAALAWLSVAMGDDPAQWRWGRVHTLTLHHPAAATPLLRELLDRGPVEHGGTWNTLNNSLYEPGAPFKTTSGVSYRLLADLAGECLGIIPGGESGHPGSPHYDDQLSLWLKGEYHRLDLPEAPDGPVWEIRPE